MYSVTNLTTIADCDVLLTVANKEKADLVFKKLSEERLVTNYSTTSIFGEFKKLGNGLWMIANTTDIHAS